MVMRIAAMFVLFGLSLPVALCQSNPEPDTPTVAETYKYISANTSEYLKCEGTTLTSQGAISHNLRMVDLLSLQTLVVPYANAIRVFCVAVTPCIEVTTNVMNDPDRDRPPIGYMDIATQDEEVAQRVARAMRHLIILLRQQSHPAANDPFAKP
jgi:hypothetical protein